MSIYNIQLPNDDPVTKCTAIGTCGRYTSCTD